MGGEKERDPRLRSIFSGCAAPNLFRLLLASFCGQVSSVDSYTLNCSYGLFCKKIEEELTRTTQLCKLTRPARPVPGSG